MIVDLSITFLMKTISSENNVTFLTKKGKSGFASQIFTVWQRKELNLSLQRNWFTQKRKTVLTLGKRVTHNSVEDKATYSLKHIVTKKHFFQDFFKIVKQILQNLEFLKKSFITWINSEPWTHDFMNFVTTKTGL